MPQVQRGARTPQTGFAQVIPTDHDWDHPRHYGQLGPDHCGRGRTYVPRVTHLHPWPPITGCQQHLLSNGPQKCLSDKHPLGGKIIPSYNHEVNDGIRKTTRNSKLPQAPGIPGCLAYSALQTLGVKGNRLRFHVTLMSK